MNFQEVILNSIEIVKLNTKTISKVAKDTSVFYWGLLIIAIGGLLSSMSSPLNPFNIPAMISGAVFNVVAMFIGVGILFVVSKMFAGKGSYMELFRVLSFVSILSWLAVFNFVPVLGWMVSLAVAIWNIVVMVIVLKGVMKFSTGKAFGVLLVLLFITLAVVATLVGIIAAVFGPQIVESLRSSIVF